jgi:hypothetical protein
MGIAPEGREEGLSTGASEDGPFETAWEGACESGGGKRDAVVGEVEGTLGSELPLSWEGAELLTPEGEEEGSAVGAGEGASIEGRDDPFSETVAEVGIPLNGAFERGRKGGKRNIFVGEVEGTLGSALLSS